MALERGNLFNIFGNVDSGRLNRARAPLAAAIFALAIIAATLKLAAVPVAVLAGAFAMLLTRCLSPEEAYRQIEWKALILIGALLSLGAAMDASGAGKFMAQHLITLVGSDNHYGLLSCFFVLTVALTQPMSNQAAALVVLPIALQTGIQLGVDPRAFGMMVAVAASCSYLTPLEPSCLMVYGPGKYRFADFFRSRHAPDSSDLCDRHHFGPVALAADATLGFGTIAPRQPIPPDGSAQSTKSGDYGGPG